jgi:hypothetical protein
MPKPAPEGQHSAMTEKLAADQSNADDGKRRAGYLLPAQRSPGNMKCAKPETEDHDGRLQHRREAGGNVQLAPEEQAVVHAEHQHAGEPEQRPVFAALRQQRHAPDRRPR